MLRMSANPRETFARVCASRKFGTAIAARMAMMATTMRSSIRVKALRCICVTFLEIDQNDNAGSPLKVGIRRCKKASFDASDVSRHGPVRTMSPALMVPLVGS